MREYLLGLIVLGAWTVGQVGLATPAHWQLQRREGIKGRPNSATFHRTCTLGPDHHVTIERNLGSWSTTTTKNVTGNSIGTLQTFGALAQGITPDFDKLPDGTPYVQYKLFKDTGEVVTVDFEYYDAELGKNRSVRINSIENRVLMNFLDLVCVD